MSRIASPGGIFAALFVGKSTPRKSRSSSAEWYPVKASGIVIELVGVIASKRQKVKKPTSKVDQLSNRIRERKSFAGK